jgi:hypothetical protein
MEEIVAYQPDLERRFRRDKILIKKVNSNLTIKPKFLGGGFS